MSKLKKHVALLYTYNRVDLLGRSIRCWLMQKYQEKTLCIFNNSPTPIALPEYIHQESGNRIYLVNQSDSCTTQQPYTNLGEIYNDGLLLFGKELEQSDIVSLWQDDDMYLPNHLDACNSFEGQLYKPFYSIYLDKGNKKASKEHNTFEGSWFIDANFLLTHRFEEPSTYPEGKITKNVNPLEYKADINLPSTYIYEWNNGVHHMSGGYSDHSTAFENHRKRNNTTTENIVIKIWSEEEVLNELKPYNL